MKKYFKAFGIALGVIILLMAVTPFFFKGKLRELVVSQANQNLNAVVSLGDLNISLFRSFPKVYVGLKNLTVTNLEPFNGDTLAFIPVLSVSVDLVDLFNGSPYSIDKIRIVNPDVRLRVMHDGEVNWDIALPGDTSASAEIVEESSSSFVLQLKSLVIEKGRLVYDDVSLPAYVVLEGLDHRLSGDLTADRTVLDTRTEVRNAYVEYDHIAYLNKAALKLDAAIDADLANSIYTLKDNHLKINELLLNFDGSVGYVGDDLNLLLTFQAPQNSFKNVLSLLPAIYAKDFASIQTDGHFSLDGYVKGIYTEENLPSFKVNLKVGDAWFKYPDLPGKVEAINIDGTVENKGGDADNTIVDLRDFSFSILGNSITSSIRLDHPISDPYIDLQARGTLDLADVSSVYPFEENEALNGTIKADVSLAGKLSDAESGNYRAFQAMGSFLVNNMEYRSAYIDQPVRIAVAQVNVSPAYLDLVNLDAVIGNSDFRVKGKVEDYLSYFLSDGDLRGNVLFDAGRIDLNELMPASTEEEDPLETGQEKQSLPDSTEMAALLIPSNIDFILNATIGELDYETIIMKNLKGKIVVKDSKLVLNGLTADAFGGKVLLNGSYETTDPSSPLVDLALGVTGTDIGEMVKHIPAMEKFAPIASKTLGTMTGNLNLASVLDGNMMPLFETIQGLGALKTSSLQISGVNTLNSLADALKMDSFKSLDLDPLNVSFQLMDGMMNVKPFDIKAGKVNMNLGGWTSLKQEISYTLDMKIPRSIFGGAANDVLDGLVSKANIAGADVKVGEMVDLKAFIDGTITDPKVHVDLAGMGKGVVNQVKEEVKQEIVNTVNEQAERILSDARAQADAIMNQAQDQADRIMEEANILAGETRKQANLKADQIEKEAKDKGALAVLAAKKTADGVRSEGDKQAQNIINEAKKQSDNVLQQARQQSDKVLNEAQAKVDKLK